jgi:DNA-directed RNA polymerase specialized sigma subunit
MGINRPRALVSRDKYPEIQMLKESGLTLTEISKMYEISRSRVSQIVNGKYIPDSACKYNEYAENTSKILEMYHHGWKIVQIAKNLGISKQRVSKILIDHGLRTNKKATNKVKNKDA